MVGKMICIINAKKQNIMDRGRERIISKDEFEKICDGSTERNGKRKLKRKLNEILKTLDELKKAAGINE